MEPLSPSLHDNSIFVVNKDAAAADAEKLANMPSTTHINITPMDLQIPTTLGINRLCLNPNLSEYNGVSQKHFSLLM